MKSIEEVLNENNDSYLWDDNKTIDIPHSGKQDFANIIRDQKCLRCDTFLAYNNEHILTEITSNVNGVHIMCRECGQKYFVHKIIEFLS